MKTIKLYLLVIATVTITLSGAPVLAQQSITGEDDIAQLLAAAEKEFDLTKYDAVILLDEISNQWTSDHRLIITVHRIIRIGTDIGVETYGDHRIPYDHDNCTFKVNALRTWRDNQWWETGETGIVETLPSQLRPAYAYANMREMMLLHNGIEIPCILEVSYTIEDNRSFRGGTEGMWLFAKEHPVVKSRFSLAMPKDEVRPVYSSPGVPDPEKGLSEDGKYETLSWTMGPLPALPVPHTDDPARYTPHIIWSTWPDWTTLGNYIKGSFGLAQVIDSSLTTSLDSLLRDSRTGPEKASLIAAFIGERTSFINYSDKFWPASPRAAISVYSSAYGHRLDRAVLAAALFNKAGLTALPVFISNEFGVIENTVPSLARLGNIGVWVSGPDIEAYYDPEESVLQRGLAQITGRTIWSPGTDEKPVIRIRGSSEYSRMEIIIDLDIDSTGDSITGKGFFYTDNCLNVFERMEGLDSEAADFLNEVMSGLIDGAEVTDYSFNRFDIFNVTAGFEFGMKKPEKDDFERLPLKIGNPAGGLYDHLPADILLYEATRMSPVSLQCLMRCSIELRIKLNDMVSVYLPSEIKVENKAGGFAMSVKQDDNRLDVKREIYISRIDIEPGLWPDLRTLLLADSHEQNRTLLFKTKEKTENKK
ncbi:MAG: hypothetical protein CVT49_06820 [candidate division Zixibacteria bacterium HGW-Zixibacteria-1]|nr:MAG: hypothetical protein CVT49_06820 [candidate division Zixibacteria bacterium HGW-Zixibacteria-1]